MESRIITLEDIRREIREHGITRTARETGFSRQHIQRIAGGQRNPSAKLLRKLDYIPITVYRDLTPPKSQ
jgi:transcriptional regulator with XRE-family HTH domain